jgi:4-aminobutyrate--pyruvate transaminase
LIADEVITGFGRTGSWFACEKYGIKPDMITLAKQLSASYFPISALGISGHVHDTIAPKAHERGVFGHGFTYGGHPVGAAVALEALQIYEEMSLPEHVERLSAYLGSRLMVLKEIAGVGDVRITGLMAGVELLGSTILENNFAKEVLKQAEERGVFFRSIDNVVAISPPLIVTEAELDRIVDVLRESIQAAANEHGISSEREN